MTGLYVYLFWEEYFTKDFHPITSEVCRSQKFELQNLKFLQKVLIMNISPQIFSHFNIMHFLDIEKADDVDVYYDSDDTDYDDEELYHNIHNGIWYDN